MSGQRTQWVFIKPCGCLESVLEGSAANTPSRAWREVYGRVQERDAALDRGIRVEHMPHDQYVTHYYDKMLGGCPHGDGA